MNEHRNNKWLVLLLAVMAGASTIPKEEPEDGVRKVPVQ